MTPADIIRFVHHEAATCRDYDEAEALCLLMPALLRVADLKPMGDVEAAAFKFKLKETLVSDFRFDPQPSSVGCGGAA